MMDSVMNCKCGTVMTRPQFYDLLYGKKGNREFKCLKCGIVNHVTVKSGKNA
jgi:hypothetical protein